MSNEQNLSLSFPPRSYRCGCCGAVWGGFRTVCNFLVSAASRPPLKGAEKSVYRAQVKVRCLKVERKVSDGERWIGTKKAVSAFSPSGFGRGWDRTFTLTPDCGTMFSSIDKNHLRSWVPRGGLTLALAPDFSHAKHVCGLSAPCQSTSELITYAVRREKICGSGPGNILRWPMHIALETLQGTYFYPTCIN